MPEQRFFDPTNATEIVSLHWDVAFTSLDLAFGGSLLTKITDFAQLRGAGLAGVAPSGEKITIRLTANDSFDVSRNDEWLVPGDVSGFEPTVASTLLAESTTQPQTVSLDADGHLLRDGKRVDEHSLGITRTGRDSYAAAPLSPAQRARVWLLWFAVLKSAITFFSAWMYATVYSATTRPAGRDFEYGQTEVPIFGVLRGIAFAMVLVSGVLTIGVWILWRMAGSYGARRAFTISKWISVAYLVLIVIGTLGEIGKGNYGILISTLIFGSIAGGSFVSFSKAQQAPFQLGAD
jgi:hypothetical protein